MGLYKIYIEHRIAFIVCFNLARLCEKLVMPTNLNVSKFSLKSRR
jgi:hypothetical protein